MSFFVLTEKCRAANEKRCKNTGKFQKASFSRLSASNALIQRKNKDDVSNFVRPRVKNRALLLSSQQLNLNVIMVAYGLLTIRDGDLSSERLLIENTEF
ncbi:hypothetical protein EAI77_09685 [Ligilactobacillus ruminis]|nr:hypothetical protein EAI77_09685 [Ligilactobacillus ruminis]